MLRARADAADASSLPEFVELDGAAEAPRARREGEAVEGHGAREDAAARAAAQGLQERALARAGRAQYRSKVAAAALEARV